MYAIAIDSPGGYPINARVNPSALSEITGQSGGRTEVVHDADGLLAATAHIARGAEQSSTSWAIPHRRAPTASSTASACRCATEHARPRLGRRLSCRHTRVSETPHDHLDARIHLEVGTWGGIDPVRSGAPMPNRMIRLVTTSIVAFAASAATLCTTVLIIRSARKVDQVDTYHGIAVADPRTEMDGGRQRRRHRGPGFEGGKQVDVRGTLDKDSPSENRSPTGWSPSTTTRR